MSADPVRDTKCDACDMMFIGQKGLKLHLASSTVCPKSEKYDAETAKEKDTKCPHCQLPCRGEQGLANHLKRSNTCPGSTKPKKTEKKEKAEKKVEKKEKKDTDKKEKAEKKDADKTEKKAEKKERKVGDTPCPDCKKLFVGEVGLKSHKDRSACGKTDAEKKETAEKKEKTEKKKRTRKPKAAAAGDAQPTAVIVTCEGCQGKFTEKTLVSHQTNSTICPKSKKYNKEAAAAAAERKKNADIPKDTECPHCKSMHRGEKGLNIHLAKSSSCPGSAKYVKSE